MTNSSNIDSQHETAGKSLTLPLQSSESEMQGIRVTRADFSRLMGCSKQAVTDWVKSGRIVVGADGRFDPRQAVASLMRTGDPARIRAKVLEPLVRDIVGRDREIERLKNENIDLLKRAKDAEENAEFESGSSFELLEAFEGIRTLTARELPFLEEIGVIETINVIMRWLDSAQMEGVEKAGMLMGHHRPVRDCELS